MQVPTVKIAYPANKRAGFAIINETDFDPKKHKLFEEKGRDGDDTELTSLRAEYERTVGKKPFGGWKADELRKRIAEAAA